MSYNGEYVVMRRKNCLPHLSRSTGISLFNANNESIKTMCEICSKSTIKTPEQRRWRRSCIFTVNFEQILHIFLVSPLLSWTRKCRLEGKNINWRASDIKKTILLLIITYQSANFEGQGSWNENVSKSKIKYLKSENFTDWFYLKEMIFLWFVN